MIEDKQRTPDQTVCRYRWSYPLVHLKTGEVKTCCHVGGHIATQKEVDELGPELFLNHPSQITFRREMIQGYRNDVCCYCWRMEDRGVQSPRQAPGPFQHHFNQLGVTGDFNEVVKKVAENEDLLRSGHPDLLEISLGPTCDLKCMYCNENYSSSWEQERTKFGDTDRYKRPVNPPERFEENFWKWFETVHRSLNYVSFIGGEPMINPDFHKIAEKIDAVYARDPSQRVPLLGVISNFNAPTLVFKKFLETSERLMNRFDMLVLASIDTVGPRAEYIRHGLNWTRFHSNVRSFLENRTLKLLFTINPTINVLSVTTMIDLLKLTKNLSDEFEFPIGLGRNMAVTPEWYNPLILPPRFASHLDECIDFIKSNKPTYKIGHHGNWDMYAEFLAGIRDAMRDGRPNPQHQASFARQIRRNDRRRGTDMSAHFPEYAEFFKECESHLPRNRPLEWEEVNP